MKLSLGNITISRIGKSSGVFFGNKNTLKQFHNETIVNEVIGSLSGSDNTLTHSHFIKNKVTKG